MMTFVLSVQSRGSLWLVADRRLTLAGRPVKEDAQKMAIIETTDGIAIIGYAGLGATRNLNEPSAWISNVLRGRKLPLEQSLSIIADAMKREFPAHMRAAAPTSHSMIAPAFVDGKQRLYLINMSVDMTGVKLEYTRKIAGGPLIGLQLTVPLAIGGSGMVALTKDNHWHRPLLRLVKAYNEKRIGSETVASHLAAIAFRVHNALKAVGDHTVGPRSIVVWRNGALRKGGGGQACYTGLNRDRSCRALPIIAHGMDIKAIVEMTVDLSAGPLAEQLKAMENGTNPPEFDHKHEEFKARAAKLPTTPDEKLR